MKIKNMKTIARALVYFFGQWAAVIWSRDHTHESTENVPRSLRNWVSWPTLFDTRLNNENLSKYTQIGLNDQII
jgi:hypothetical protein